MNFTYRPRRPSSQLERLLGRLAGDGLQAPEPSFPIDHVCNVDLRLDPPQGRDDDN